MCLLGSHSISPLFLTDTASKVQRSGSDNPRLSVFHFYELSIYPHFLNLVYSVGYLSPCRPILIHSRYWVSLLETAHLYDARRDTLLY